jgi:hypothetical protein
LPAGTTFSTSSKRPPSGSAARQLRKIVAARSSGQSWMTFLQQE